ncbi:MAG: hypothetical protein JWP02_1501 [Acidimicrobiales bacterium]|nr:hypothetical protein [Acidimicrobiales bacterium]
MASVWDQMTASNLLGMTREVPASAQTSSAPSLARSAGPSKTGNESPLHVDNPLFWFGALALVTFGLVAVSTSVRLGPGRASVSLGKP